MKSLTEIQNELKAPKNQYNSFGKYKYRSCEDILEAVKPLLKKHDCTLTITDEVKEVGGMVFIEATATLISHEYSENGSRTKDYADVKAQAGIDPNRKGMDIAQSFGSSSSYARKYALNGLFLIDDTKDADATNTHGKTQSKPTKQTVTEGDQTYLNIIKAVVDGKGTIEQAKGKYNISKEVEDSIKEKVTSLAQL